MDVNQRIARISAHLNPLITLQVSLQFPLFNSYLLVHYFHYHLPIYTLGFIEIRLNYMILNSDHQNRR